MMPRRSPIKRHSPKRKPGDVDPEYVAWIKTLPCAVPDCHTHAVKTRVTIEAHHAGDHGLSQRAPDRTCVPLCVWHHRHGGDSIHGGLGRRFWAAHRIERDDLIRQLNADYDSGARAH